MEILSIIFMIYIIIILTFVFYGIQMGLYHLTKRKIIMNSTVIVFAILTTFILFRGSGEPFFSPWLLPFIGSIFLGIPITVGSLLALLVVEKRCRDRGN